MRRAGKIAEADKVGQGARTCSGFRLDCEKEPGTAHDVPCSGVKSPYPTLLRMRTRVMTIGTECHEVRLVVVGLVPSNDLGFFQRSALAANRAPVLGLILYLLLGLDRNCRSVVHRILSNRLSRAKDPAGVVENTNCYRGGPIAAFSACFCSRLNTVSKPTPAETATRTADAN